MSGLDRPLFGLLEQLTSTDLNNVPGLGARTVLDAMRYSLNRDLSGTGAEALRDVVIGGLTMARTAAGVDVQPGALLQAVWISGAGTQPGIDDSQSLLARLAHVESVAVPVLGGDTWYLIEARCGEVDTAVNRLFWNPTTSSFDVSIMTVRENVIEFQALAGGVDVPLPDVGWVPIAAVFSRSNGATDPADVCDMRPLAGDQAASSDGEEIMLTHNLRSRFGFPTDVPSSFLMSVDVDLYDRGGRRMFARATSDTSEMDLTALFSPGLSLTNSTWFYLYLCRWGSKYTPRGAYAGVTSQGILVVSDVAPSVQGRRDNSAPITLPSPWATVPVPIGEAVCIGALASDPSNAAGLGFRGMSVSNGRVRSLELPFSVASLFGPAAFLTAAILPKNARGFVPRAKCDGVSPGGVVLKVQWPNVSPTRQMHWTLSRENATLNQITTYFDCRGVPVTQIWCASDPGFTYCDIYEMEI